MLKERSSIVSPKPRPTVRPAPPAASPGSLGAPKAEATSRGIDRPAQASVARSRRAPLPGPPSPRAPHPYRPEELNSVAELGYTLYQSGMLEDAEVVFRNLVALEPGATYFGRALAAIQLERDDVRGAISTLERCFERSGATPPLLLLRAHAALALSDRPTALHALRRAASAERPGQHEERRAVHVARALLSHFESLERSRGVR